MCSIAPAGPCCYREPEPPTGVRRLGTAPFVLGPREARRVARETVDIASDSALALHFAIPKVLCSRNYPYVSSSFFGTGALVRPRVGRTVEDRPHAIPQWVRLLREIVAAVGSSQTPNLPITNGIRLLTGRSAGSAGLPLGSAIAEGSEASFHYNVGTMLFLSKRTAMRWEVRAYNFHSGSEEARVSNNNIAFTLGTSLLF